MKIHSVGAVLCHEGGREDGQRDRHSDMAKLIVASHMFTNAPRDLTLRRLMSYIYIYMEHPFLMFLDHTQRRSTVGRTPLDE